jgi:hypothetical protein
VFTWVLLAFGCASEQPADSEESSDSAEYGETESAPSPTEQLDACELPEPCTDWTEWDFCGNVLNQDNYEASDVCTFEALLAEPPNVVRAFARGPACEDLSEGRTLYIYRWSGGSMTCARRNWTTNGIGETSGVWQIHNCTLPDTATIEACLADAQAALPVSDTCLHFDNWGLVFGAAVEPTCGP